MADTFGGGDILDVERRPAASSTIVLWEPESPGVGLRVTYELIRRHTARVTLAGELDFAAVDTTRDALFDSLSWAVNWIEVDAGDLAFCDVAGLELFLELDQRCGERAGGLRIVDAQRQLTRLLELAGVSMLVTRVGSEIG